MASLRRTLFGGLVATKINKVIYTIGAYTTGIVQCRGTHFCGSPAMLIMINNKGFGAMHQQALRESVYTLPLLASLRKRKEVLKI